MRSALLALLGLSVCLIDIRASDDPDLACEVRRHPNGSSERFFYSLYVKNISDHEVSIAAYISENPRPAPWKPTDTYSSPYIMGTGSIFPIITGTAIGPSDEPKEMGTRSFARIIDGAKWHESKIVVLKPSESITCNTSFCDAEPKSASARLLRLTDGAFKPSTVSWTASKK